MIVQSTAKNFPDYAKPVLSTIEDRGFTAYLDTALSLMAVRMEDVLQVRTVAHTAPAAEVTRYADAMKSGHKFPPVVVTLDGVLIDGNTRFKARKKINEPDIDALVIDERFSEASDEKLGQLRLLGGIFNSKNGRACDREEIKKIIWLLEEEQYTADHVARLIGRKSDEVNGYFAAKRCVKKLTGSGMAKDDIDSLIFSVQRSLGRASTWMHDAPFKSLSKLCIDAQIINKDLADLIRNLKATPSDEEMLKVLAAERTSRNEQIKSFKATGRVAQPTPAAKLRQLMGVIFNHEGVLDDFVETNIYTCHDVCDRLEDYAKKIGTILEKSIAYCASVDASAKKAAE